MVPELDDTQDTVASAVGKRHGPSGFSVRKPISPFLSSTQEDFLEERQFLAEKIFPEIDEICRQRGTYFSPTNLQWKPTDPHVVDGHILRLSLDVIMKSSPFYICMIGERYGLYRLEGSLPLPQTIHGLESDADWLDWNLMVAASAGHSWVLGEDHQHCSFLELEILQAAFLSENDHCLFYFRQPEHLEHKFLELSVQKREKKIKHYLAENEECKLLVRDLKQRIVKKGLAVKYFRTLCELGHMVLTDWLFVLDMLFPQLADSLGFFATEEYSDWVSQERFAETRQNMFLRTSDINQVMAKLSEFATSCLRDPLCDESPSYKQRAYSVSSMLRKRTEDCRKYPSILTLSGERGSGKSTIIANWIPKFSHAKPDVTVMVLYVGGIARSSDISIFMRKCCREMRRQYLLNNSSGIIDKLESEHCTFVEVYEAFLAAVSLGPCVLVIDGIDELSGTLGHTPQQIKKLEWLAQPLPPQCKLILTCVQSDLVYKSLTTRSDVRFLATPSFSTMDNCSNYLEDHTPLTFDHVKHKYLLKIWECNPKLKTRPLFLSLLANELRCYNVFSHLANYLESLSEVVGIREFWTRCLQRWITDHSWTYDHLCNVTDASTIASSEPIAMVGWVADALRLIAVSRNGLRQSELLALLKRLSYSQESEVSEFDWLYFRECVGDSLYEGPGGLINFSHQHLKEGVEYTLLSSVKPMDGSALSLIEPQKEWQKESETFHQYLADYFLEQPHTQRRVEELPWQLVMARNSGKLYKLLSDPLMFSAMTDEQSDWPSNKLDLRFYWSVLKTAHCDPSEVYLQMLEDIGLLEHQDNSTKVGDVSVVSVELSVPMRGRGLPSGMPRIVTVPPSERGLDTSEEYIDLEWADVCYHSYSTEPRNEDDSQPVTSELKWLTNDESDDTILPLQHSTIISQDKQSDLTLVKCSNKDMQVSEHRPMALSVAWNVAVFMAELGKVHAAEKVLSALHDFLSMDSSLSQEDQFLRSRVEEKLGGACSLRGDVATAERWYKQATKTLLDIPDIEEDHKLNLSILNLKGKLLTHHAQIRMQDGREDDAEDFYLEAQDCLDLCHDIVGKSTVLHNLAVLKVQQRDYLRAEALLCEALICRQQWFGQCNSVVADTIFTLASLLSMPENTRGYSKLSAELLYRRALLIREKCLRENHPMVATTLYHLGKLLQSEATLAAKNDAVRLLRRALDIRITNLGDGHTDTKQVRTTLRGLEVSLQLGQYEFGPAKPVDMRSVERPYSALTWRDKDLATLQRKVNSQRSVMASRPQSSLRQVRSTSATTSRQNFTTQSSPSERLLLELDRPNSRLLKCSSAIRGNAKGKVKTWGSDLKHQDSSSKLSLAESVNSAESPASVNGQSKPLTNKSVILQMRLQADAATGENNDVDSFEGSDDKEGSLSSGSYKGGHSVLQRPQSGPVHLYKRYSRTAGSRRIERARSALESRRRIGSGRSSQMAIHTVLSSYSASSGQSHRLRCAVPGPHSINPSKTYSLGGPNSSVNSLMSAPCPRDVTRPVHHQSAWYHIPGRYVRPHEFLPTKRSQTRLNSAKKSIMALQNMAHTKTPQIEKTDQAYQDLIGMEDLEVTNNLFLTEDEELSPSLPHGGATVTFKEAVIIG